MKTMLNTMRLLLLTGLTLWMAACTKDGDPVPITIFSLSDDIALGKQIDQEIMSKPGEYPVLDSATYKAAYEHLYRVRNTLLASGKLSYAGTFQWKCRIIHNDSIINAFCVPGGNLYFYTGLIRFLDNEAQFAGIMAHEMAHADRRHTSQQMTVQYGEAFLLGLILGNNPSQLAQIIADLALGLGNLAYSREHEYSADSYAVKYLYVTEYDAASVGAFFEKMAGEPYPPVFLSTHPSPPDRLEKINEVFQSLGGVHGQYFPDRYQQFKTSLP